MLVLRRRSQEVIVFEGGLMLSLLELADHKAWLGFEAPSIDGIIAISPLGTAGETMMLGVRSPLTVRRDDEATHLLLDAHVAPTSRAPMLVLTLSVGEQVCFEGMALRVGSITNDRAGLEINVPCLSAPVTISVQSVSGIEARIGIDAPDDLRVMRKELWLDLIDANQTAAQWSNDDMDSLRTPAPRAT